MTSMFIVTPTHLINIQVLATPSHNWKCAIDEKGEYLDKNRVWEPGILWLNCIVLMVTFLHES